MISAQQLVQQAKANISEISPQLATALLQQHGVLLIDVREFEEYHSGHIAGARHASRGMLEFKIADLSQNNPTQPIVLYCKTGGRAALCAQSLQNMGYTQVQSIAGGIDAWQQQGHGIVQPKVPNFG